MAKIKDLGINVIPETMRPPEVGHGGCKHTYQTDFTACCPVTCHVTTGIRTNYFTACCPGTCHVTTGGTQTNYVYTGCCPGSCHVTTTAMSPGQDCMRDWIAQLKEQFQQQIAQLEEYEKAMGPRTAEEIDAREKALKAELADLAERRKGLKGK